MSRFDSPVFISCYANDLDAFIPEIWAQETLEILRENMIVANMVHRDFQNAVANYGDRVHTQRPAEFKTRRRTDATSVTSQDVVGADVPVDLNQWYNETFTIRPSEMSKSYKDLVKMYLEPAMIAVARGIDRAVLGRLAAVYGTTPSTRVGRLASLSSSNVYGYCVELDQILNQNKAPVEGRKLVVAPSAKAQMLQSDKFIDASYRGDGGQALKEAMLGRILGFDCFMAQNVNNMATGADIALLAVNNAAKAAEYASTIDIVITGNAGEFLNIAGNDQPTWMLDKTSGAVILNEALKYATAATAVVTHYKKCDAGASYLLGHSEKILVDGYTSGKPPQVGQLLATGVTVNTRKTYTIIETEYVSATSEYVLLDRPLEAAITEEDDLFPGPYGSFNVGFVRNTLALVTRPLAPVNGAGMLTAVADAYGLGVRVSMQDQINVGRVVAVDLLAGVAVLDSNMCVPLLG